MTNEYDWAIAEHYQAYRPPLHQLILERCLDQPSVFQRGLDIGCGTGYSSIALSKYCDQVLGIDPSTDMLAKSISHPKVTYQIMHGQKIPFNNQTFGIVTLAGAWYYAKSQVMLDEIFRVTQPAGMILIYDFSLSLVPFLTALAVPINKMSSRYNHQADFTGLNQHSLRLSKHQQELATLKLSHQQVAHLILSEKRYYLHFLESTEAPTVLNTLLKQLQSIFPNQSLEVEATLFYQQYLKYE